MTTLSKGTDPAAEETEESTQLIGERDPRLVLQEAGLKGYLTMVGRRITGGELGSLPVVIGLMVIWLVFYSQENTFLSAENLTNLIRQMTAVGTISVGIVLVLLLGEVDLSVGSVSGMSAALMGTQIVQHERNQWLAIGMALVIGGLVGLLQGFFFARFGVPAFVVTLAGLIGWQGLQLRILGNTGIVNLPNGTVKSLTSAFYPAGTSYALAALVTAVYAGSLLWRYRTRSAAGLPTRGVAEIVLRAGLVAVAAFATVYVLDRYRGLPFSLVLFLGIVVAFDLMIRKTTYGRHILAVGGNIEAARRAGISVTGIRLSVFMIAGIMAAAGGVLASSFLGSVSQTSGGSDTLLNAIAAAVIGGTSLFGGRGSAWSAFLGILVVVSISNGMALLGLNASTQFMVTGAVLLASVTLDALSRRGRSASGRG